MKSATKTARANRLTKEDQQQWWKDNAALLKRDRKAERTATAQGENQRPLWGPAEYPGVGPEKGQPAPKPRNVPGYDQPEWYRDGYSTKEAPGKPKDYTPQGWAAELPSVPDKRERSAWLPVEESPTRPYLGKKQHPEPWQNKVKLSATHQRPYKEDVLGTVGDLPVPQPVQPRNYKPEPSLSDLWEQQRVLGLPQGQHLEEVTWCSNNPNGKEKLLWAARLRYAKRNKNPEKGARVVECQLGNWRASVGDLWQADRELRGELALVSVDNAPQENAETVDPTALDQGAEEEGLLGKTSDPLYWLQVGDTLAAVKGALTERQWEALARTALGQSLPTTQRRHLQAALPKAQAVLA